MEIAAGEQAAGTAGPDGEPKAGAAILIVTLQPQPGERRGGGRTGAGGAEQGLAGGLLAKGVADFV